jgi:hypothetical protein
MSDNGCQPTALAFMKACSTLGIQPAFTSDNNAKGNAVTERVMRTLTEECLWLSEWSSPWRSCGHWKSGLHTTTRIICTHP